MPIRFACDECARSLNVRDSLAGRRIRCPHCAQELVVPQAVAKTGTQTKAKPNPTPTLPTTTTGPTKQPAPQAVDTPQARPGTPARPKRSQTAPRREGGQYDEPRECFGGGTPSDGSMRGRSRGTHVDRRRVRAGLTLTAIATVVNVLVSIVFYIPAMTVRTTGLGGTELIFGTVVGALAQFAEFAGIVLAVGGSSRTRFRLLGYSAAFTRLAAAGAGLATFAPAIPVLVATLASSGLGTIGAMVLLQFMKSLARESGHERLASRALFAQVGMGFGFAGLFSVLVTAEVTYRTLSVSPFLTVIAAVGGILALLAGISYLVLLIQVAGLPTDTDAPR